MTRRDVLTATAMLTASAMSAGPVDAFSSADAKDVGAVTWVRLSNGYKVWTKQVGSGEKKLLLLHGGPGLSHDYMNCFADILPGQGYEIHLYDQLGCGLSDRPADRTLWTLNRYVAEVEEVQVALGLEHFVLVGHSWGSVLAIEYALKHQDCLQALILSNMTASAADYDAYNDHLKRQLPIEMQDRLSRIQKEGAYNSAEYGNIIQNVYFPAHAIRMKPWPKDVVRSLETANPAVGNALIGPDQFRFAGELEHWDRWQALTTISTPALVMGARHDFMNPDSIRREAECLPHGEAFISPTGSHLAMWDDQKPYFDAIVGFLQRHAAERQQVQA
jgi:proline iminopeptidase